MMLSWKKLLSFDKLLFAAIALLVVSAPSWASSSCTSGLNTAGPGAVAKGPLFLSVSTLQDSLNGSWSINAGGDSASGCYQEFVFTSTSPQNAGDLTFVYQFSVTADTNDQVGAFTADGYKNWVAPGFLVPGQVLDGGTPISDTVSFFSASGDTATWDYAPGVIAGQNSDWLFVRTTAQSDQAGTVNFIDGGTSTFAGLSPAPEPSSLLLFGTGLLSFAGILRRRLLA